MKTVSILIRAKTAERLDEVRRENNLSSLDEAITYLLP